MTLQEFGLGLRRSLWTILSVLVVVLVAVGVYLAVATKSYTAKAQVFVSATPQAKTTGTSSDLSQTLSGSQFVINTIQSYALLSKSDSVTGPVVTAQHLDLTPSGLARKITTDVPLNTLVLQIGVRDGSASRAATLANAIASQLVTTVGTLQSPTGNGESSPVRLTVVQHATVPSAPASPSRTLDLLLGVVGGLGLGLILALARGKFADPGDTGGPTAATQGRRRRSAAAPAVPETPAVPDVPAVPAGSVLAPAPAGARAAQPAAMPNAESPHVEPWYSERS